MLLYNLFKIMALGYAVYLPFIKIEEVCKCDNNNNTDIKRTVSYSVVYF